jgi:hypothetical protein
MLTGLTRDRIRTLRLTGARRDPLALRLALQRALGAAELRPPGLPPGAILCVRKLRLQAPWRNQPGWPAGVQRQVQALLPSAARPFREAVPTNAPAVLFADEAELLACLARDRSRGDAGAWWWHTLFGEAAGELLVQRVLLEAPEAVPSALALLAESGLAADALRSLPLSYCERLAAAVAATFAVPGWTDDPAVDAAAPDRGSPAPPPGGTAPPRGEALAAAYVHLPAEREVVALVRPQRALLGISLLLCRAPALARSAAVAAALREGSWPSGPDARTATRVVESPAHPSVPSAAFVRGVPGEPPRKHGSEPEPHDPGSVTDAAGRVAVPVVPRGVAVDPAPAAARAGADAEPPVHRAPAAPATQPFPKAEPAARREVGVESGFAGVLYLVNLALYLEIYGDFTQPMRPGLALPIGDFLALAGERACGLALRDDPLWEVLAALAGRAADEPPGCDFEPPAEGPHPPTPSLRTGHQTETERLASWLDPLMATLEARAALALGVPEGEALPWLCAQPGRVVLTPTRLDGYFSLAAHPLAIRIAGLDRNPGWVPAAGRILEFHYD